MKTTKTHCLQRAVWRNGGSNSAECDVRIRTEVARRTFSVSRRFAKPPPRYRQVGKRSAIWKRKDRALLTTIAKFERKNDKNKRQE